MIPNVKEQCENRMRINKEIYYKGNKGATLNENGLRELEGSDKNDWLGVARCTQRYCWCTQHHLKMPKMSLQCFVVRIKLIRGKTPADQLDPCNTGGPNTDQVDP